MHHKTALKALAGCLAIWLAMGSLSFAAPLERKIADLKFCGALSETDQNYAENQDKINLTVRAGRHIASLFAVAYPTEGATSPWISKPFW
ncbi:MAG: hypothetical protein Q7O12_02705 [Deltaproteobacteria bacterium]|nr:hypothetical protein [Deltaproteobacteria bacterium]